jgi:hypothetical protein
MYWPIPYLLEVNPSWNEFFWLGYVNLYYRVAIRSEAVDLVTFLLLGLLA